MTGPETTHLERMTCAIQEAGLCEGCSEGVEALRSAYDLDLAPPIESLPDEGARILTGSAEACFRHDLVVIRRLGVLNRDRRCEGALSLDHERRRGRKLEDNNEGVDARAIEEAERVLDEIAAQAGIDRYPRLRCELKQREIERMHRRDFFSEGTDK